MKKNILSIFIIIFVTIFSLILVFGPKIEFSENENRYLEKFPNFSFEDLMSGKYIKSLENYITDHFPFRDTFMTIKTKYQLLTNQKLINGIYVGKDEYLFQKYKTPVNTDKLINKLNLFYANNEVNMNLMLVPSSGVINKTKLPNNVSFDKQLDTIDYIYKNINFNSINVYDSLKEGSLNYPMYYRLDHHWTTYGAYYAYLEFCKHNNLNPISLEEYDHITINDFNGTLYSKVNIYSYEPDKIDVFLSSDKIKVNYVNSNIVTNTLYEEKNLNKKDKYTYFLNGNHPLIEITNDSDLTDELLIIKDSYANSFIPFLTSHYKKIHVIDLRFYKMSVTDYIKEHNIQNVLFLYNIQDIDNDTGIYMIK